MEVQRPVSQCIASYPVDLASSVELIQEEFPYLLPVVKRSAGGKISVKLAVDLPIQEGGVLLSDLRKKNISTQGFREDLAGRISIEDLAKKNIVICRESAPACWKWSDKTIYVAHSSYGNEPFYYQEYHQVLNILFEMHNACQTKQVQRLTDPKNRASKLEFVRAFEGIEHNTVILTRNRLNVLTKKGKFHRNFNIYRTAYDDPELHFMHQQLMGHAFAIARKYDVDFFPHAKKEAFHGTWETKFEEGNDLHQRIREALYEILNEQLYAIADGDRSSLNAMLEKVMLAVDSGEEWASLVMSNLNFFQGKYRAYVQRESPTVVVNILEVPRARPTCHEAARKVETGLLASLIQWIKG